MAGADVLPAARCPLPVIRTTSTDMPSLAKRQVPYTHPSNNIVKPTLTSSLCAALIKEAQRTVKTGSSGQAPSPHPWTSPPPVRIHSFISSNRRTKLACNTPSPRPNDFTCSSSPNPILCLERSPLQPKTHCKRALAGRAPSTLPARLERTRLKQTPS
jgi:hypothetical protein